MQKIFLIQCLYKNKSIFIPVVSPRPSCPQSFLPQPNTPPETDRMKLCSPPAATWTTGISDTHRSRWGDVAPGFLLPKPSWPLESWPHVYTWPSVEKPPRLCEQQCTVPYCNLLKQTSYWTHLTVPLVRATECWLPQATWETGMLHKVSGALRQQKPALFIHLFSVSPTEWNQPADKWKPNKIPWYPKSVKFLSVTK